MGECFDETEECFDERTREEYRTFTNEGNAKREKKRKDRGKERTGDLPKEGRGQEGAFVAGHWAERGDLAQALPLPLVPVAEFINKWHRNTT